MEASLLAVAKSIHYDVTATQYTISVFTNTSLIKTIIVKQKKKKEENENKKKKKRYSWHYFEERTLSHLNNCIHTHTHTHTHFSHTHAHILKEKVKEKRPLMLLIKWEQRHHCVKRDGQLYPTYRDTCTGEQGVFSNLLQRTQKRFPFLSCSWIVSLKDKKGVGCKQKEE